jgi:hypothetical protein
MIAFGEVSCMEKHRLLPHMTASLYLGLYGKGGEFASYEVKQKCGSV